MSTSPKTVTVGTFAPGMDNRRPDFSLRTKEGYLQRDAVNIDLTGSGSIKRRRGYTLARAGVEAHSIWSDDSAAFYVDGTTLYALSAFDGDLTATAVATGLTQGLAVSYWPAPEGGTYWTDGRRLERVVGGASIPLTPPPPIALPVVVPTDGYLAPGLYMIAFCTVDSAGRESELSHPVTYQLGAEGGANGGAMMSTGPLPAGAVGLNVYMSNVGGEVLFFSTKMLASTLVTIVNAPLGGRSQTVGLQPMPAGQIVRHYNGRLLVASGAVLFISEPFMPGLYNPTSGYIPLPKTITILEPTTGETAASNGVFLVADQTYWLDSKFPDCELRAVLPYGAIPGTSVQRPDSSAVQWMSVRGLVEGDAGKVTNLQEEHVAIVPTAAGASLLRDSNGTKQAITSLYGVRPDSQANASSYMEAEIVHRGTP